MVKYEDWLTKSLEELENDFYNGVFKPQNESDVKCHIYHKLMEVKPEFPTIGRRHRVNTGLPCTPFQGTQEKIDLALMSGEIPRLIIEIKETSKDHLSLEEASNKIAEDADKIRRFIESTINQSKIHRNMRKHG